MGIGAQGDGLRAYLAIEGGFAIAPVLETQQPLSCLGATAVVPSAPVMSYLWRRPEARGAALPLPLDRTTVRVVQALLADFTPAYLDTFYASEWEVHYNSFRTGIRLLGPKPEWVREDGGEQGFTLERHDNASPSAHRLHRRYAHIPGPMGQSGALFAPRRWPRPLLAPGQLRPDKLGFEPISLEQAQPLDAQAGRPSPVAGRWRKAQRKRCCEGAARAPGPRRWRSLPPRAWAHGTRSAGADQN